MYKLSTTSFSNCAHSVAIVSHAITITSKAVPKPRNRGYSFDQRLFVLTKTIQWSEKGSAGEDKLVVEKKNIYYMSVEPVAVVSYVSSAVIFTKTNSQ